MATAGYDEGVDHAHTDSASENNEDAYSLLPFDSEFLHLEMDTSEWDDGVDHAHPDSDSEKGEDAEIPLPFHYEMDTAGCDDGIDHAHPEPDPDSDSDSGSEDSEDARIIFPFDNESLRPWATSLRNELMNSGDNTAPVECTAVRASLSGSYNTVFPLEFSDGVFWALKVPKAAASGDFDASAAHTLTTEALTLRILKRETTIPVPELHHFHAGLDNSLQYPYILTDFIEGVPLFHVWQGWSDNLATPEVLESRRMNALQDIAEAMVQLGKFTFTRGGSPTFDSSRRISDVGPLRRCDIAMSLATKCDSQVWCDLGPFTNTKSHLLAMLDRRDPPPDEYSRGVYQLLRFFIEWLSELEGYDDDGEFVLAHPDLDYQNILVTDEGKVCGIIDWEGVEVVPACVGNLCYPSFLTRDWDTTVYDYDSSRTAEENKDENSPEELRHFRAAYCDMIEKLYGSMGTECPTWTRKSLVMQNLQIAADNPITTHGIVDKIFEEMKEASEKPLEVDGEELDIYEVACELAEGCLDEDTVELLKDGFLHLCNSM
ncbi:kinase-like domain-containing protein [Nemania serpens]|nr:kinase-like domain-containing protein [Nemania serpens]